MIAIYCLYCYNKKEKKGESKVRDTIIYLVRHAETIDENGIRNTNEDSQMINEKEILSVEGEEQAKKISENDELKIWMLYGQVVILELKQQQNILQIQIIYLLI